MKGWRVYHEDMKKDPVNIVVHDNSSVKITCINLSGFTDILYMFRLFTQICN